MGEEEEEEVERGEMREEEEREEEEEEKCRFQEGDKRFLSRCNWTSLWLNKAQQLQPIKGQRVSYPSD